MSPPQVPGVPGLRLPEPWEREVAAIKERLDILEARATLQSIHDEDEISEVKIPSDAPKAAKSALGALAGVPAAHRAFVLVVLGLAALVALVLLVLKGVKVF